MKISEEAAVGNGLFGYINSSTIKNVTLENINIALGTGQVIGGIAGHAHAVNISDCTVSGKITVKTSKSGLMCGGIVGIIGGNSNITNCSNTADINCAESTEVGGIVGDAWATLNSTIRIIGCTNTGNIVGGNNTGEIAGTYGAYPGSSIIIE